MSRRRHEPTTSFASYDEQPFRWSHARKCTERIIALTDDDEDGEDNGPLKDVKNMRSAREGKQRTQRTTMKREDDEEKISNRRKNRTNDRDYDCDHENIETIKREIDRVEKLLNEKRKEREISQKFKLDIDKKKKRIVLINKEQNREINNNNNNKVLTWIDRRGPEPASRAMARRLLETLEEKWPEADDEHERKGDERSSSLITFKTRPILLEQQQQRKKTDDDDDSHSNRRKMKTLETIARETSRQIHAQCRDRGELVDAVLDRYRDIIELKDQKLEEAILENRRLEVMRDFAATQSERDSEEKIALAKNLANTRREKTRVNKLNEKISSEFTSAKMRWQEISNERKNRRDVERDALIKSRAELKHLKETMFREIRAQTMVLEKKLALALDARDDSKESLQYAEDKLRIVLSKSPRGKPVEVDTQTCRRLMLTGGGENSNNAYFGMYFETVDIDTQTTGRGELDYTLVDNDNESSDANGIHKLSKDKKRRERDANGSIDKKNKASTKISSLGGFARLVQTSKIIGREKPKSWCLRTVAQIYSDKIAAEKDQQTSSSSASATNNNTNNGNSDLACFAYEWHVHRYGLRQLAETNCLDLIASCKAHSTSSLKIRQFAAFCGLLGNTTCDESCGITTSGEANNNNNNNNSNNSSGNDIMFKNNNNCNDHFDGGRETFDFYLKVLDSLAPGHNINALFPENESANGKSIKVNNNNKNANGQTAGPSNQKTNMMNFDDSGKVTFSHACEAVKTLLPDVLANEKSLAKIVSRNINQTFTAAGSTLTEKEKMDALARAFLFQRGVKPELASSSSSTLAATHVNKNKIRTGTTVDADDVVSILMIEHEKRSKRNTCALLLLFRAMHCEDANSMPSPFGLSREDFYAAFRIASDGALTEANILAAWKECVAIITGASNRSSSLASSSFSDIETGQKQKDNTNVMLSRLNKKKKIVKNTTEQLQQKQKLPMVARIDDSDDIGGSVEIEDSDIRVSEWVFLKVAKNRRYLFQFEIPYARSSTTLDTTTNRNGGFSIIAEDDDDEEEISATMRGDSLSSIEEETREWLELCKLFEDLKSKTIQDDHQNTTQTNSQIAKSLLRCEKLREKYINERERENNSSGSNRVGGKLSRRDKQFIRSLALKAFSNELSKILAKRRGGIKRVGELVRATVSFKLRNILSTAVKVEEEEI